MTTPMMNISNKETIRASTELRTGFKLCVINPGIHIMDNKASTSLKNAIITMDIKYQLFPQKNHRSKIQRDKSRLSRTVGDPGKESNASWVIARGAHKNPHMLKW